MSWKPCRGSGIMFDDAFNREMKYRNLLIDYQYKPVGFMRYSKTYYHWMVAERDLRKISTPSSSKSLEQLYGQMIPQSAIKSLEQHKHLCYKPLQRLMP